jgi:hypothetical protein
MNESINEMQKLLREIVRTAGVSLGVCSNRKLRFTD